MMPLYEKTIPSIANELRLRMLKTALNPFCFDMLKP
jgi:hypothetical protein